MLIDQYKALDAINDKLDDCPCVKSTQCKRMVPLLTKAKVLIRTHPERRAVISYIRSQTCDTSNRAVKCCSTESKVVTGMYH